MLRSLNVKQDTGLHYKNGSLIFSRVHSSFGEQESSIYACKKAVCVDAFWGFPGASILKRIFCQCRRCRFHPWVRKFPWRRKWQPIPVFLPGKSHRQRSLVGYRPQGCKESDTNEKLNYHHSLTNFMKLILSKLRTVGTAQSQMTVSVSNSILMSNIL